MAWYKFWQKEEKLNPVQPREGGGSQSSREPTARYEDFYERLEIVNRGTNMIVDDVAEIPIKIGEKLTLTTPVWTGEMRKKKLNTLLNYEPNPFQDINAFRRNLVIDLIIDGNIFIYFDGVHLYHLPACKMTIETSRRTFVEKYTYNKDIEFSPNEIIHVKENSFYSVYRGDSRLKSALRTMILMKSMRDFQDNFFKNGAVPGLVIKSPNVLSQKIKDRLLANWSARFNPRSGGKRPLILDGGLAVDSLNDVNFKDLDFQNSIADNEKIILKALGVPPILLDSGNNANIRPNLRLYYLETVLPIVRKINYALERYFGYKLDEDTANIPALQPELKEQANFYTSLTNGGIIAPNEAREGLGMDKSTEPGMDEIRIPANIAGSASNPAEGGRPSGDNTDDDDS